MSEQAWYEHFKEQLHGLTDAFEKNGTSVSLLKYAFQNQRLNSDAYLLWATKYYMLPQLHSEFFAQTTSLADIFEKWGTHYPWSEECLPIAEWDGSLIVACLQPPQDFPRAPSCAFILADPESLSKAWLQLHPKAAKTKPSMPQIPTLPEDAPDGFDLSVATMLVPQMPSDSMSFDNLGEAIEVSENPADEAQENLDSDVEKSDALEGLFDGPTVVQLKTLEATQISTSIPEPLALEAMAPVESTAPMKSLEESANEKTVVAPSIKVPPAPPSAVSAAGIVSSTPRTTKPKASPVADGSFSLEKIKTKNALLDEKIKAAFSKMKTHFQKSLILTLDEEESQLKVYAWDESFRGMKDASMRLPLKTPSMFNIVASTQKPFHGYISLNDINEQFFETWNQGQIPDHVTITPLLVNDKLVGMLMGLGEKSAYNKTSLNLAEKISADFAKGLQAA